MAVDIRCYCCCAARRTTEADASCCERKRRGEVEGGDKAVEKLSSGARDPGRGLKKMLSTNRTRWIPPLCVQRASGPPSGEGEGKGTVTSAHELSVPV